MTIDKNHVRELLKSAKEMIHNSKNMKAEMKAVMMALFAAVELILTFAKFPTNSQNSSVPPSQDMNRVKVPQTATGKKPGGQMGRKGTNLKKFENADEVIAVPVDIHSLPKNRTYRKVESIVRQVVEMHVSRHVIEYRLEVLEDENGKQYTAKAPTGVSRPVQYGNSVKTKAVYMNQFQLIPYKRVENYFCDQMKIPISQGSLVNFNIEAFHLLEKFEEMAKEALRNSSFLHVDETGINVNGKRMWLHNASNNLWTLFMPHEKRGSEAMDSMDILTHFKGVAVHDHWKAYFKYDCDHALCNAHHLRELQAMMEAHPQHTWASLMKTFLENLNSEVHKKEGVLKEEDVEKWKTKYFEILELGNKECPPPEIREDSPKKRGRAAKTKERNLLERLQTYSQETLGFMTEQDIPFTNNQGERDLRMTKVHQKVSGCFKSFEGAEVFCRIRSYLLTAQKHGISPTDALTSLFEENFTWLSPSR